MSCDYKLLFSVDCGSLDNPGNGVVSFTDTTYNSVATYSCNTGYTLTGDDMRTCQSSGVWSDSEPTCTGKNNDGEYNCFVNPFNSCLLLPIVH